MKIRFNYPHATGKELEYIHQALENGHLSGNGPFTQKCQMWLERDLGAPRVLLTHSCTAALEMSAILADLGPGDEVIMPSYTFVSTANAFVLRGAIPVFVDIRPDTLNLDETKIEAAITERTRAIVVVHYAGVCCDMTAILEIARRHGLMVIEDAAQALGSQYKNQQAGTFGDLAAISFHETKNIISGEGGALVINNPKLIERAEIIWEKGTNRSKFFRGEVDKYTWVDIGSSFLPSELVAAFLWAQLEHIQAITASRMAIWEKYMAGLSDLFESKSLRGPHVPPDCRHNAHMFYLLAPSHKIQSGLLKTLKENDIGAVFHYVPLHSAPAGRQYGRAAGELDVTVDIAERLIRLPLWPDMSETQQQQVIAAVHSYNDR